MKPILKKFFEYLDNEEFEEGSSYMQDKYRSNKLALFCHNFLLAKHIVEISYSYAEARKLYNRAAEAIREMDMQVCSPLAEFADMQAAILKIDRGIYTGYAPLMHTAAKELQKKTDAILTLLRKGDDEDACFTLLERHLAEKVQEDSIYADAIIIVAQLYLDRWKTTEDLDEKLSKVQAAVDRLEEMGNERLSSDLAPHIHVIKRFEERRGSVGKLFIKNGEVAFYYYASLDYRIREEFNKVLKEPTERLYAILGSIQLVAEEMSDIWSGFNSMEFIDTYKFKLHSLRIDNFRELDSLEASVELKYYTMGVFEIKISFLIDKSYLEQDAEGLSLSALRHLQSLGTPFALDEKIVIEGLEEKYKDIAEYVEAKFLKLQEDVEVLVADSADMKLLSEAKVLKYNAQQNRFTIVRINQIVEHLQEKIVRLRSQNFQNHFQYKALVMPVREVRSAIDNWIMYDASIIDENLAGIRYNESEWLSVNRHASVIALLEQPVWVFDQAIESVEVASAVVNMLILSNRQASLQLESLNSSKEHIHTNPTVQELKDLRKEIELQIEQLDEFKLHLLKLLETVEAGAMMTYPDHTLLMQKIFKTMQLEPQQVKSARLQLELKDRRSKLLESIKKINDRVVYSQQKIIKVVVSIASVFIALGSLVDMFQLWSSSKTVQAFGLDDPDGDFKLEFVLLLAIVSTLWLLYDNFLRQKDV